MKKTLSLQWRLLRLLGLILLILLLLTSIGIFTFVRRTEQQAWQGRQKEATSAASQIISTFIWRNNTTLSFLGQISEENLAMLSQLNPAALQRMTDQAAEVRSIARYSPDGDIMLEVGEQPDEQSPQSITQEEWFVTAIGGEMYMGAGQTTSNQEPYIILARRARDGGVTVARLSMLGLIADLRFGDTGNAYIVNQNSDIVAHTNPEHVHTHLNQAAIQSAFDTPGEQHSSTYTNFEGVEVVGTTLAIPDTPWVVVTEISKSEAYETSQLALQLIGEGLFALGLLTLFLTYRVLQQYIFKPIADLKLGTEVIAGGNLEHQVPIQRDDEIGQVTLAFNEMVNRVREREDQLMTKSTELSVANEKLEETNRLKSEFLSTMSHELRTPLNAILGYSGLLLMGITGKMDEEAHETVKSIEESSEHLLNLINDILDIAKIEAGRMRLMVVPFALSPLVHTWQNRINVLAMKKNLPFEIKIDPALPEKLYGDEERLTQIAFNLLSNAVKFTHEGKVLLEVKKLNETEWMIQVQDSGIGIPPDALDYIFDEFRQVDGSYKRSYGGTGLGLAIVRKLVSAMDGQISVTSILGQGSTFTVTLPLKPVLAEKVLEHA